MIDYDKLYGEFKDYCADFRYCSDCFDTCDGEDSAPCFLEYLKMRQSND